MVASSWPRARDSIGLDSSSAHSVLILFFAHTAWHRLRAIADISERETIDRILKAVGYERRTGPKARAPTQRAGSASVALGHAAEPI
jgi:hypothetical protein